MLYRLITVCILTHIGYLHFADLVDNASVIRFVKDRRKRENGVKFFYKFLFTAHQFGQAVDIVEYRPRVVPAVSFGEGIAPFEGVEGRLERAVRSEERRVGKV